MLTGSAPNDWCSAGKVFQSDTSEWQEQVSEAAPWAVSEINPHKHHKSKAERCSLWFRMLFKVGQLVDNPNCTLQFLSFEKPTLFPLKRNGENKKVYTYNVFVITDFFLQKRVFKKRTNRNEKRWRCCTGACGMFRVFVSWGTWMLFSTCMLLFRFVTVKVLKRFKLLDECFVLILQHSHSVFQTFHVLFLFPAAFPRCLPVVEPDHYSQEFIRAPHKSLKLVVFQNVLVA